MEEVAVEPCPSSPQEGEGAVVAAGALSSRCPSPRQVRGGKKLVHVMRNPGGATAAVPCMTCAATVAMHACMTGHAATALQVHVLPCV